MLSTHFSIPVFCQISGAPLQNPSPILQAPTKDRPVSTETGRSPAPGLVGWRRSTVGGGWNPKDRPVSTETGGSPGFWAMSSSEIFSADLRTPGRPEILQPPARVSDRQSEWKSAA